MDDRFTIKLNLADRAAQQAVDLAVHNALARFRDQIGENEGLVHRIAKAAAANAVDQFKTWCNAELRLIEVEHDRITEMHLLKAAPPSFIPDR